MVLPQPQLGCQGEGFGLSRCMLMNGGQRIRPIPTLWQMLSLHTRLQIRFQTLHSFSLSLERILQDHENLVDSYCET